MRTPAHLIPTLILAIGCNTSDPVGPAYQLNMDPALKPVVALGSAAYSEWSVAVNLGPSINTAANEQNATLSKDGLSLYFTSNRSDGLGNLDIWVSQRASVSSSFLPAENLGAPVNTTGADFAPNLSSDGHLLFFASNRDGNIDIYVSSRTNKDGDFSWGQPVRIGAGVNTEDAEQAPMYLQSAEDGPANLYFNRGSNALGQSDIYSAAIKRDGGTLGPAVLVAELSAEGFTDAAATLRKDGKEVFFFSTRPGGVGGIDLWTSNRQSIDEAWTEPVNVTSLNTMFNDQTPSLSHDGRTLVFASNRPGSLGNDIWISTRTSAHNE
jgi:Tol biopolymer transport system component